MDINLQGKMNGIEAAEEIVKKLNIPVIFITGYSDNSLREKASKINPLGYFLKPINIFEVIKLIEKYLKEIGLDNFN